MAPRPGEFARSPAIEPVHELDSNPHVDRLRRHRIEEADRTDRDAVRPPDGVGLVGDRGEHPRRAP